MRAHAQREPHKVTSRGHTVSSPEEAEETKKPLSTHLGITGRDVEPVILDNVSPVRAGKVVREVRRPQEGPLEPRVRSLRQLADVCLCTPSEKAGHVCVCV